MVIKSGLDAWWARSQFSVKDRSEFYETLTLLLDNRVMLSDALAEMFNIYSDEGKHPNRVRAQVAQECLLGVSGGKPLSAVLANWVSYDEFSLIEAGEQAGDLQSAFRKSMAVVSAKAQIGAAVASATIYPAFLFLQAAMLLKKISTDLVPKLGRTSNPDAWSLPARALKWLADIVVGYGLTLSVGLFVLIVAVMVSMPYLRGPLRFYLDKIPPWSIYRMLHGSTFALNIGVLLGSGVKLNDVLHRMSLRANPWLKERIDATLYGIRVGSNLGKALHDAGYDFPDKRAVQYLRIISGREGAEDNLERFGERWLESSVKDLKRTAGVLLSVALLANAGLMILVMVGVNGIADAMLAGMSH